MYRELTAVALRARHVAERRRRAGRAGGQPPPDGVDLALRGASPATSARSRGTRRCGRGCALASASWRRDAVLEGRDTGSIVCPEADLKVFLVASSRRPRRAPGPSAADAGRPGGADDRGAGQPRLRAVGAGSRCGADRHRRDGCLPGRQRIVELAGERM